MRIKFRGHVVEFEKHSVANPRLTKDEFSFVSCLRPNSFIAEHLGVKDYKCFKCPDNEGFNPSGDIYVDVMNFLDNELDCEFLYPSMINSAKQKLKDYEIFPVWLSRENGRLIYEYIPFEGKLPRNKILFGALATPYETAMDLIRSIDVDHEDWFFDSPSMEVLLPTIKGILDNYSSWVNGETWVANVSPSELVGRIIEDASPELYREWKNKLISNVEFIGDAPRGVLNITPFDECVATNKYDIRLPLHTIYTNINKTTDWLLGKLDELGLSHSIKEEIIAILKSNSAII